MAWCRGCGLPVASAPREDRVATRFSVVKTMWWRTSCHEPPTPPLSFIWHCATGAHQPCLAGRPRSGHESRAPAGGDQSNILPLDLILYLLTLYILFLFIFHHRSMHRAASSSQSVADRFSSYNTRLCSKTDPLTLGPLLSGKHRLYHKPMSTMCFLCTHWPISL